MKWKWHVANMLLRVQFIRIMKVIMTYDYWICRTSLALSLCKKYQIVCATVQLFVYMHEKHIPMQGWICMKCPHTYKSCWRWSVSQFSTCVSLFSHGCHSHIVFEIPRLSQMAIVHFPWPDEWTISPDNGLQLPITAILSTHL